MTANLKPYAMMKDSGLPWLGKMPEHWEVRRGKGLLLCIDVRSTTGAEELLTVSSERGVVLRSTAAVTMFKAESYVGHKLCWPGDLVVNSLWAWGRGLGVSAHHGIVSSAYGVYRLRQGVEANPRFIHELVRSTPFNWELQVRSKGVWISRLQLTDESFLGAPFLLPPLPEQDGIVRFLDHADRRIRRYIRAKQKLIKLLEEQKRAIIDRAVSRGLNASVRRRPSSIEWLGDVPEHWEAVRLKNVAEVQTGITLGKTYGGSSLIERPYLRVANVQAGRLNLSKINAMRIPASEAAGTTLRIGDVLMTEGGDIDKLGRGCVWRGEIPDCLHQNHIFAVRPKRTALLPEFLVALMGSSQGRRYFEATAKQTTNLAATNSTTVGNFLLRLPPVEEQREILDWIDDQTRSSDTTIAGTTREISLLHEYRTRLIADVVTGKLDVGVAAACVSPEVEEIEGPDDADASSEGLEDSADGDFEAKFEETEA